VIGVSSITKGVAWLQFLFVGIVFLFWFICTHSTEVSPLLLPEPIGVLKRLNSILISGEWIEPLQITLTEVMVSFFAASITGIFISFFMSRSKWVVEMISPVLNGVNAIPAILFFPLFALIFGLGLGSKIALGFTISFFPIVINTLTAFSRVEVIHINFAKSAGANNWLLFRFVLLPSALPLILTGLRIGLTLSFLAVLGGETIASFGGLGHQIAEASQAMDSELMYAWILLVISISFALSSILTRLERIGQYTR
jgi:ABC-type nitrate/sulfonate/bicarbonate transport system permease component